MDSADYQKKKSAETLLMQNAPAHTPKTQVGQTSVNSISENVDSVKSEFSDTKDFTEFKKEYVGRRFSYDDKGFFFIDRKSIAEDYASSEFDTKNKGRVLGVYIRNTLPKYIESVEYKKEDLSQVNPQLYKWLSSINDNSSKYSLALFLKNVKENERVSLSEILTILSKSNLKLFNQPILFWMITTWELGLLAIFVLGKKI